MEKLQMGAVIRVNKSSDPVVNGKTAVVHEVRHNGSTVGVRVEGENNIRYLAIEHVVSQKLKSK